MNAIKDYFDTMANSWDAMEKKKDEEIINDVIDERDICKEEI